MKHVGLDPKLMDYEVNRKSARKRLLKKSRIPVIMVSLMAVLLALPMTLTHIAIQQYEKNQHEDAKSWIRPLSIFSPEPFVIAYNKGTIDTKLGNYEAAESALNRAVAIAPKDKKCMAAQNLATSLDMHSKSIADSPGEATQYAAKRDEVVAAHPDCFKGASASGGGGSSSGAAASSDSPSDAQQDQLEQKEQKGQERKEQLAQEETFDPTKPKIRPW